MTKPTSPTVLDASGNVYSLHPATHPTTPRTTLTPQWVKTFMPGGWLGDYVDWSCATTHTSPTFQLAAGLAFAATELAIRGWKLRNTSYRFPALWFVLLATSGAGKGTAIRRMQSAMTATDSVLPTLYQLPGFKEGRTISMQGTPEGVLFELEQRKVIDESGQRTTALLINEEFHSMLDLMRRVPAFQDIVLSLHDQIDVNVHQRSIQRGTDGGQNSKGRSGTIPLPCCSTLFVSTEAQLINALNERHLTGGFAPRFFWLGPDELRFWPSEPMPRPEILERLGVRVSNWIQRLCAPSHPNRTITFPTEGPCFARHVHFAQKLFDTYGTKLNGELYTPRLANQTQVLACVIAAVETLEDSTPLAGNVMVREEHYALAQSIAQVAETTVGSLPSITAPRDWRQGKVLLQAIQQAERLGLSTYAATAAYQRTMSATLIELKTLQEMGLIVGLTIAGIPGGQGRPPTYWFASEHAPTDKEQFADTQTAKQAVLWDVYQKRIREA